MSRITAIPAWKLRNVMEKAGLKCVRTEGDHFVYVKPGVIPDWDEVPVFSIKNNLRTAGISRDEYFELLSKV
jgi:predicted RNA binding protein YcfA (HicA-like mRNA interferase family)